MDEPVGAGTIVRDAYDHLWMRVWGQGLPWVNYKTGWTRVWPHIEKPTLVHEGYVQETPEPKLWGAILQDADGKIVIRTGTKSYPWKWRNGGSGEWFNVPHPVKILFEGVE